MCIVPGWNRGGTIFNNTLLVYRVAEENLVFNEFIKHLSLTITFICFLSNTISGQGRPATAIRLRDQERDFSLAVTTSFVVAFFPAHRD